MILGSPFDEPVVVVPVPTEAELLAARVVAAIEQLQMSLRDLTIPAPRVVLPEPDLADIVTAVTDLKQGPSADEIAEAIARTLKFPDPPSVSEEMKAIADALEKLEFRLKGRSVSYGGGGSVSLNPGQSVSIADPTTGFKYYVASTVTPLVGEKVRGVFAASTNSGSVTIFGGASIPIVANGTFFDSPEGLIGDGVKTIFFSGCDTQYVRVLT